MLKGPENLSNLFSWRLSSKKILWKWDWAVAGQCPLPVQVRGLGKWNVELKLSIEGGTAELPESFWKNTEPCPPLPLVCYSPTGVGGEGPTEKRKGKCAARYGVRKSLSQRPSSRVRSVPDCILLNFLSVLSVESLFLTTKITLPIAADLYLVNYRAPLLKDCGQAGPLSSGLVRNSESLAPRLATVLELAFRQNLQKIYMHIKVRSTV